MPHFDVIIGNPPYQSNNPNKKATHRADLWARFLELCLSLKPSQMAIVLPTNFLGSRPSVQKENLFASGNLVLIKALDESVFDIDDDFPVCYLVMDFTRKVSQTAIIDMKGRSTHAALQRRSNIFLQNSEITPIMSRLQSFPSMAYRWKRGKKYLSELVPYKAGSSGRKVTCIRALGSMDDLIDSIEIVSSLENTTYGNHKVVIPNVYGRSGSLGSIKVAGPETVICYSIVALITKSDQESRKLQAFLRSTLVKWVVKNAKSFNANSQATFALIPDLPKTLSSMDDAAIYAHFGLNGSDISLIESH